ncbi:hypothetical protein E3J62_02455 [candidate division TA06 bacterium]|uniref:Glycosyltransferase RgtA/B/C/D-like domain-containing protein n=1 Tax=candidate division TA06 bacterium TaxID=2250710 RepID=A0A523UX47_UNCT6|nr:MAG: hypothetical protein E3J62_02455 [candidate division TA06 bacterium]
MKNEKIWVKIYRLRLGHRGEASKRFLNQKSLTKTYVYITGNIAPCNEDSHSTKKMHESDGNICANEVNEVLGQTRLVRRIIGLLLILGLLGVLLVLTSTSRFGPGVSPDSVAHVSTARNLLSGKGYVQYDGSRFVSCPPLFPTLLASIGLCGFDPLGVARYLNAICFGAIIFISGLWLLKNIQPLPFALLGAGALLLSKPLIGVSAFAWPEPLFVLLVLVFVVEAGEFLERGKSLSFILLTISAMLAFLTHYLGIAVILAGLVILYLKPSITPVRRFVNLIMFATISALPTIVWLVGNRIVSSELTREIALGSFPIAQNLWFALHAVSKWFLPLRMPTTARIVIFSLLFILMLGLLAAITARDRNRWARSNLPQIMPSLCFLLIYLGCLVASATGVAFGGINDRLLSPIYVPLILLMVFTFDNLREFPDRHFLRKAFTITLIAGFSIWLAYRASRVTKVTWMSFRDGPGGYATAAWRESNLVQHIRRYPLHGQVYSNAPDAVYILAGESARLSPRKHPSHSPKSTPDDILKFKTTLVSGTDTYLVWFENNYRASYLYSLQELRSMFDVDTVAATSDGAVYLVR